MNSLLRGGVVAGAMFLAISAEAAPAQSSENCNKETWEFVPNENGDGGGTYYSGETGEECASIGSALEPIANDPGAESPTANTTEPIAPPTAIAPEATPSRVLGIQITRNELALTGSGEMLGLTGTAAGLIFSGLAAHRLSKRRSRQVSRQYLSRI